MFISQNCQKFGNFDLQLNSVVTYFQSSRYFMFFINVGWSILHARRVWAGGSMLRTLRSGGQNQQTVRFNSAGFLIVNKLTKGFALKRELNTPKQWRKSMEITHMKHPGLCYPRNSCLVYLQHVIITAEKKPNISETWQEKWWRWHSKN